MSNTRNQSNTDGSPALAGDAGSGLPERTDYPQAGIITMGDTFERGQIIEYLDRIPLGERSERDHRVICAFITRAQRHFAELDNKWEPSND